MKYNPDIHHRRSVRLKNYDYSSDGAYFITICTENRENVFGNIAGAGLVSAQMELNNAGEMIELVWRQTIEEYRHIACDKYIIMPNHFHCIINISKENADSKFSTVSR
jgi:REP element-mobilizing transposase RayT